jgi:hypothetical protein
MGRINAMSQLLYPWGKNWHSVYRRLGGPTASLDRCRKSHPPPGFDPQTVWLLASYCTDYASLAHTTSSTTSSSTTTTNSRKNKNQKKDDDCGGNNEKCGIKFLQQ